MASRSLYGQEPSHIAPFDFDLLKVARGKVKPRQPHHLLPPEARGILSHYSNCIEKNSVELAAGLTDPLPTPHWDEKLRTNAAERRKLLLHLAKLGLVSFRRGIKAKAG
eukprot:2161587-Karenia_brevis.AAC.1